MIDKIKLQILHDHIQTLLLNLHQQDSAFFAKVKGDAEYLARELFPPMPKALVFVVNEFDPFEQYAGEYSVDSCRPFIHWACFRGMNLTRFKSLDAAKAACEAHSQARFLKQLA